MLHGDHATQTLHSMSPRHPAADVMDANSAFLSLPQAWLGALITSHLDSASRVALFRTCHTLCELVLSAVRTHELTVNVSPECWGASTCRHLACTRARLLFTYLASSLQLEAKRTPGQRKMLHQLMTRSRQSLGMRVWNGARHDVHNSQQHETRHKPTQRRVVSWLDRKHARIKIHCLLWRVQAMQAT